VTSGRLYRCALEFLRRCRIAQLVGVKIYGVDTDAVFHFALAKIVQERTPPRMLFQILSDVLGEQNVSSVAAIHDALCNVDAGSSNVRLLV
jgi:hypothetical protein